MGMFNLQTKVLMNDFLRVNGIYKKYNDKVVLDNICLSVNKGEIFGIIGSDGAGKTTLFQILNTLTTPDAGQVFIRNEEIRSNICNTRKLIGYMPGKFSLYSDMTVQENITFIANIFNIDEDEYCHIIEDIYNQLKPFKNRKARNLSGGMKQKLALCCALIHEPNILLLDEPTTGVDPVSRKEFWRLLDKIKSNGVTVIVATPYMDEALRCDRIALIKNGIILKVETPENLINQYRGTLLSITGGNVATLLLDIREHPFVMTCFAFGCEVHATSYHEDFTTKRLGEFLKNRGHKNLTINKIQAGVEDCYIQLVKQ